MHQTCSYALRKLNIILITSIKYLKMYVFYCFILINTTSYLILPSSIMFLLLVGHTLDTVVLKSMGQGPLWAPNLIKGFLQPEVFSQEHMAWEDMRIRLSAIKPDSKESCRNIKQCHSSHFLKMFYGHKNTLYLS